MPNTWEDPAIEEFKGICDAEDVLHVDKAREILLLISKGQLPAYFLVDSDGVLLDLSQICQSSLPELRQYKSPWGLQQKNRAKVVIKLKTADYKATSSRKRPPAVKPRPSLDSPKQSLVHIQQAAIMNNYFFIDPEKVRQYKSLLGLQQKNRAKVVTKLKEAERVLKQRTLQSTSTSSRKRPPAVKTRTFPDSPKQPLVQTRRAAIMKKDPNALAIHFFGWDGKPRDATDIDRVRAVQEYRLNGERRMTDLTKAVLGTATASILGSVILAGGGVGVYKNWEKLANYFGERNPDNAVPDGDGGGAPSGSTDGGGGGSRRTPDGPADGGGGGSGENVSGTTRSGVTTRETASGQKMAPLRSYYR